MEKNKLRIESFDGKAMTLEFHYDSDLDDMREIFRQIMLFLTFMPSQISDVIPGEEDWEKFAEEVRKDAKE